MNHLRNKKGGAMVITIVLLMIVSILGLAMLATVAHEVKLNRGMEDSVTARYLAQAGIDHGLLLVEKSTTIYPHIQEVVLGDRSRIYNMHITKTGKTYRVVAAGIVEKNGNVLRQVTLTANIAEDGKVTIEE